MLFRSLVCQPSFARAKAAKTKVEVFSLFSPTFGVDFASSTFSISFCSGLFALIQVAIKIDGKLVDNQIHFGLLNAMQANWRDSIVSANLSFSLWEIRRLNKSTQKIIDVELLLARAIS